MRRASLCAAAILGACLVTAVAVGQLAPVPESSNALTQFLDWADIHPASQSGRLTFFPITLSRQGGGLGALLTMQQAMDRGVLVIEELPAARVAEARFTNKGDRMIFLMAGEVVTGGKQNRTLATDALLGPDSSTVLPLYCVEKGRWEGGAKLSGRSAVAPQAIREKAVAAAGQDAIWSAVAEANERMGAETASQDLAAAMHKPENLRRLEELRGQITPRLPRGCVGVVVAVDGRIVGADLFHNPELFADMRDKVLNSYFSQYGWHGPLPVREGVLPVRPRPEVTADQVREYLRDCYRRRFASGEQRGVGRVYYLRGQRSGQTLVYGDRQMVHTSLTGSGIIPVRPEPGPRPLPEPMPR